MQYSILPFLVVLGVSLGIGIFFSRSSKKSAHYYLGDRSLTWFPLAMTFVATQIGGGFILGTAEAAFQYGAFGVFYAVSQAFGLFALALGFGSRLRALELNTTSDLFEKYYGSRTLKRCAALLSIISLTGILIAQAVGLRKFLYSMGWPSEAIFLASWCVVVIYTVQGGFLAVVWTDLVQAIVMIGALLVTFGTVLFFSPHLMEVSWSATSGQVGEMMPELGGMLLIPFLFMFIEQDMVQRCFAGKNGREVSIAAGCASLVLFAIACIPVYFGCMARDLGVEGASSSKFMDAVFLSTNGVLATIAASAVLLAVVSTASSLLCAASSNLAQDFFAVPPSPRRAKALTAMLGFVAYGASFLSTDIFGWMIASYELAVDCLFVPLVVAVFTKEACLARRAAATGSVLSGAVGFVLVKSCAFGMIGLFLPLALSGTGYLVGMMVSRRKQEEVLA